MTRTRKMAVLAFALFFSASMAMAQSQQRIITGVPVNVTAHSATLQGSVPGYFSPGGTVRFCFVPEAGLRTGNGTVCSPWRRGSSGEDGNTYFANGTEITVAGNTAVTLLLPGQRYYYQAQAAEEGSPSIIYGQMLSFVTPMESAPTIKSLTVAAENAVDAVATSGTYRPGIVPRSLASLFGEHIGTRTITGKAGMETELDGVSVLLNGTPTTILGVSPSQAVFLVPAGIPEGTDVQIVVVTNREGKTLRSVPATTRIMKVNPGVIAIANDRFGLITASAPLVQDGDGIYRFVLACAGLGATNAPDGDGLSRLAETPTVVLNGVEGKVTFAGLMPGNPGIYQVNVELPPDFQPVSVNGGGTLKVSGVSHYFGLYAR